MLLGLFQANQNAFDGGDINRLKAGKILSIPDKATLEAIPRGEAKTIIAQSSNWEAYRRRLATVAADAPGREEGARQAAGRITTRVEDRAGLAAEPKDQLKVSKTDLPGTKPLSASKRTDEDLIAKEKALKDANERLASLERNVAELQRLVELKSQNLADLERQSAAKAAPAAEVKAPAAEVKKAEAATPSAPLPTPVAAPPAPAARVEPAPAATPALPAKPMESPVEVKPAETVAKPEVVTPMPEAAKAEVPPVAAPPKPVEVPKARPVPPPPEEPGFIEWLLNSTAFLAAGGALIALLAAYWLAKPLTGSLNVVAPVTAGCRLMTAVPWRPCKTASYQSRYSTLPADRLLILPIRHRKLISARPVRAALIPMKLIRLLKLMFTWRTAVTPKPRRFFSRQNRRIPGATPSI